MSVSNYHSVDTRIFPSPGLLLKHPIHILFINPAFHSFFYQDMEAKSTRRREAGLDYWTRWLSNDAKYRREFRYVDILLTMKSFFAN